MGIYLDYTIKAFGKHIPDELVQEIQKIHDALANNDPVLKDVSADGFRSISV
jgi:hypothetical protein